MPKVKTFTIILLYTTFLMVSSVKLSIEFFHKKKF